MKALFKFLFTFLLVTGIAAAGYGWYYAGQQLPKAGPLAQDKTVNIEAGSGTAKIAELLTTDGVLANPYLFRFGAWRAEKNGPLKAGEYEFKAGISVADAIALIQSGKVYQRHLTIPEGLTSYEIVQLVNKAEALDGQVDAIPAEGSLLPETYNYTYGDKRTAMIDRMATAMKGVINDYWPKRTAGSLVKTPLEAVTLASIVERETALTSERPRIAGVFMNRIKINWPLQSDPTVIYALTHGKGKLDRPLTHDDLSIKSPYNTYVVGGLPPGPISNPGKESLIAVLAPEANAYLFFVADGTGGHAFASTLAEHNANINKWRTSQQQQH